MITGIVIAAVLVGGVGLFIGLFLGVAGKKFAVEVDEKEIKVREELPGNNCGGCGYPGCDGLAAAIAKGEAPVNACPVGGAAAAAKIAAIMGIAITNVQKSYNVLQGVVNGFATAVGFTIAIVLMAGLREKMEYNDVPKYFQGFPIVLLTAGLMAIAFFGFSGII